MDKDLLEGLKKLRKALGYNSGMQNMSDIKTSLTAPEQLTAYQRFLQQSVSDTELPFTPNHILNYPGAMSNKPIGRYDPNWDNPNPTQYK